MDFKNLYLNFNGRIRRSHYWIGAIVLGVAGGVLIGIVMAVFGGAGAMMGRGGGGAMGGIGLLIACVIYLAMLWGSLALMFKRIHDRGRGAIFLLLLLVPLLNLWPTIELLFLDGTQGENQYGPSPKGITSAAPTAAA